MGIQKKGGEESIILMILSMIELSGFKNTLEWILNLLSPLQGSMDLGIIFVGLRFSSPYAARCNPFRAFESSVCQNQGHHPLDGLG